MRGVSHPTDFKETPNTRENKIKSGQILGAKVQDQEGNSPDRTQRS
jgi:hypothetical protein